MSLVPYSNISTPPEKARAALAQQNCVPRRRV
jgi:hypothetical protein